MSHPFRPNPEQESLSALRSLVIDIYERGDPETARRLPVIAYRIANTAADRQSERLLHNALDIWLMQIALLPRAKDNAVGPPVADLIAETAYYVIARFASQMENDYAPLAQRLGASPFLHQLASFEAEALKLHVDRRDRAAFSDAYLRWSDAWFRHWSPEREVDDLDRFRAQDPEIAQRLERARRLSDAKAEALRARSRALLELGAWVAYERRRDRLDQDDFSFFSRFLVGVFPSSLPLVDELANLASEQWEAGRIERWVLFSEEPQPRVATRGWVGGADVVTFWLTLLLTRFMTSPTSVEHRPEGLADWLVEQMLGSLDAIGEQWAMWQEVVGDDGNVGRAREWLNEERSRGREAGAARIRDAPLDPDRVAGFIRAEQDGFVRGALVREQVILVGASRVEQETHPTRGVRLLRVRRDMFVAGGPMLVDGGEYGAALAREIDMAVFTALREVASPAPGSEEPVEAIIAVADEMVTSGLPPDAILAPASIRTRLQLGRHPRFRWRVRGLGDDQHGPLGYVDELPVYDVGPEVADHLVIVSFKKAMTLVEYRTETTRPVDVSISPYTRERADEEVRQGFRFSDQPDWAENHVADTLVRDFVEVRLHLDYEVVLHDDASDAGRRVYIPVDPDENV